VPCTHAVDASAEHEGEAAAAGCRQEHRQQRDRGEHKGDEEGDASSRMDLESAEDTSMALHSEIDGGHPDGRSLVGRGYDPDVSRVFRTRTSPLRRWSFVGVRIVAWRNAPQMPPRVKRRNVHVHVSRCGAHGGTG
jgi:hypothetical protein